MLHPRQFIERSQELLRRNFNYEVKVGMTLARGFADLGHEEFSVLNNDKILSLFTGDISSLPQNYKEHFFPLFSCDELIVELFRNGAEVRNLKSVDRRTWELTVQTEGGIQEYTGKRLQDVLLEALVGMLPCTK